MSDFDTLRALEHVAIDTDLAHRQAKAEKFIGLVGEDGELHQIAFKELEADPELIELEREARRAAVELKIAWKEFTAAQKAADRSQRRPWWAWLLPQPKEATE